MNKLTFALCAIFAATSAVQLEQVEREAAVVQKATMLGEEPEELQPTALQGLEFVMLEKVAAESAAKEALAVARAKYGLAVMESQVATNKAVKELQEAQAAHTAAVRARMAAEAALMEETTGEVCDECVLIPTVKRTMSISPTR